MAFTGDLEQLHIVDVIQLIHTTRKSGTFSIKGPRGESRVIFSNGYIVGANHLNNRIRIGTVLVKLNTITPEDLKQALEVQKKAKKDRKPLLVTLIESGKLRQEEAAKGLKKLIEITIVELIGWTKGTFTLDTEAIAVSPDCSYIPDRMEQTVSLDAQMVLMDALRIYDERERDRNSGKHIPPDEELFAEVIPSDETVQTGDKDKVITADVLGLADLEHLEKKIPSSFSVKEIFSPIEIHRQNIKDTLGDFSSEEQDNFVSFLEKCIKSAGAQKDLVKSERLAKVIILFSRDRLIKHSVMTICKNEGILVFATDKEEEFYSIIDECLAKNSLPVLIFDSPETSEWGLSEKTIVSLRQQAIKRYPRVSSIQFASVLHYTFFLQSFSDGVIAVFPRPLREARQEMFIEDTIKFLETFKSYINDLLDKQQQLSIVDNRFGKLREKLSAFRDLNEPIDISFALLQYIAEIFERSITFIVRPAELTGERALGVHNERDKGPSSASRLKIPLTEPSVFRDVIEKGQFFYGECDDEVLREYLYAGIGAPLKPTILILPVKSRGKIVTLTYGDYGKQDVSPAQNDILEILADQAGLAIENAFHRKMLTKTSRK
ncbi:MAG: DUF4388 domain-containing protein [Thermodesulfovibrionales bacterium]